MAGVTEGRRRQRESTAVITSYLTSREDMECADSCASESKSFLDMYTNETTTPAASCSKKKKRSAASYAANILGLRPQLDFLDAAS